MLILQEARTFVGSKTIQPLQGVDVDNTCEEFENGSALHIAAANLGLEAAKALIGFGADLHLTDDLVIVIFDQKSFCFCAHFEDWLKPTHFVLMITLFPQ